MAQRPKSPWISARERAVQQLNRVEADRAYVGLLGGEASTEAEAREERQATEYVAGITRWRRWLDFLLASFYQGPFDKMERTLKQILRVGLYDLLFLDTPPHAAVHEAVELAKRLVRPGAGGLVNGILRAVQRRKGRLPEPGGADQAERLALRHSHPTWMVRRWLDQFGAADTEALLRWNNERPIFGLRVNPRKVGLPQFKQVLDEAEIEWEASHYLDDFIRVPRLQPVLQQSWLDEGLCVVQDESAGLVVHLLDPQPGETVIDTCAAPGGKVLYAATRMENGGRVIAADIHPGRLRLVAETAQRIGLENVETKADDLREWAASDPGILADRVLVDAPCSGLGVLSKRADLRWQRTPEEMHQLTDLQDELLNAAARLVRPGGLLVYSTCTIDAAENHERVQAFLAQHPNFHVESAAGYLPDDVVSPEGYLTTFPPRHQIDGAFGARLRLGEGRRR